MNKQRAIELAGSRKELCKILNISPAAISQWRENLPMMRVLQLKLARPEWFANEVAEVQEPG